MGGRAPSDALVAPTVTTNGARLRQYQTRLQTISS